MPAHKPLVLTCLAAVLLLSDALAAPTAALTQTQSKIKQLDAKIKNLQQNLASANDKKGLLAKELVHTEKKIGEGVNKLRSIQYDMNSKEQKISQLQNKVNELNQQLATQQQLLAKHVRARYQMGEYQPIKWLLNQDKPYEIGRIFTYYQYMLKSRQELISHISDTQKSINDSKQLLHSELATTKQLKQQLASQQQQLEQHKNYHTALIKTVNNDIASKQHSLQDFERDKNNLGKLLKSLSQVSVVQPSRPFNQMRKKLPFPIANARRSMQRMNQGVTFFADEGVTVNAIYPGKVVFSDWLKGYGLLLIIDHGQGFMSLYAHNQSLFKRKGQAVAQNEQIASVGHSGGIAQNGLYFEIRLRGKAVSPLDWLS
ncbi:MAG: murein hydrolase activator EnvC family protein [Legionella sp.]